MVHQGDCAATLTPDRPKWTVFGLLICANTAFILLFNPSGALPEDVGESTGFLLMGAIIAQPMLFAIWAALGTGTLVKRVPLTLAALVVVELASGIKQWNVFTQPGTPNSLDVDTIVSCLALFGLTMAVLLVTRAVTKWRIDIEAAPGAANAMQPAQFSIKYLIALTTLCALLLTVGRALGSVGESSSSATWRQALAGVLSGLGFAILAVVPALLVPLVALTNRNGVRLILSILGLWICLLGLGIWTSAVLFSLPLADAVSAMLLLHGGAAAAGLLSALAMRLAGYRVCRSTRVSAGGELLASVP